MWQLVSSKRLKELEERVMRLRRDIDDRDLDWVDMRSRCKRLLDRTEKAARLATSPAVPEEPENGAASATPSTGFLSERQRAIQQQIMRRRGGL